MMYKKIQRLVLVVCLGVLGLPVLAQDSAKPVEMADQFRASGKIYVVIAVLVVILLGLILYVARLDRKISRLEADNCPSGKPLSAAKELK
jgi:heme export protein D (CcmD)